MIAKVNFASRLREFNSAESIICSASRARQIKSRFSAKAFAKRAATILDYCIAVALVPRIHLIILLNITYKIELIWGQEIKTLVVMIEPAAGASSERKISTEFKLSALSGEQYLITHAAGIRTHVLCCSLADKYIRDDVCTRREYRSTRVRLAKSLFLWR